MSDSKSSATRQFSGDAIINGDYISSDPPLQQMEPILRRLESIDSKVSALNERDVEYQRLLARLKQVETNFNLLYHTSRSEIANLKRNIRKDSSNSNTNRPGKLPNLDPRRPICKSDLIACLHSTVSVAITQVENSTNSSRHATTGSSSSNSSSSDSSSISSSSSSSSPLSSDTSHQNHRHQNPFQNNGSNLYLNPEASTSRPAANPVKQADSKPTRKREEVQTKSTSTDVENGVAAHLMRLVGASIRNAREHHAYSVRNAPPLRGCISNAEEAQLEIHSRGKSVVDPHLQSEKSCRSTSTISPSKVSARKLESASPLLTVLSTPRTPEERGLEENDGAEMANVNVGYEKEQQHRKAEVEVITEEESASGDIDESFNNHTDSPRIDIEKDVSDVESHVNSKGGHLEAMSEGEVNDEVDDDTLGEDHCRIETNSKNHSNPKRRSLPHQRDRSRARHRETVRYETSRGRRNMPSSRERRHFYRNDNSIASPRPSKRTRHPDDEPYARPPNRRPRSSRSSPRRNHFMKSGSRICRNRAVSPVVYRTSAHRPFNQRH